MRRKKCGMKNKMSLNQEKKSWYQKTFLNVSERQVIKSVNNNTVPSVSCIS